MSMKAISDTRGFTLIETLVAITVITLAVAGPLTAATRAVASAQFAREQLTASYLAQEGIEYVRLMRDNEYLAFYNTGSGAGAVAWNDFLTSNSAASITSCIANTCTLDPARQMGTGSGFSLLPCSGNSCTPLYLANGIYTEQSGISGAVATPYKRTIQATTVSGTDERITSIVTWVSRGVTRTITITDHLTPWE